MSENVHMTRFGTSNREQNFLRSSGSHERNDGVSLNDRFHGIAKSTAYLVGMPWSFVTAVVVLVVWAMTGPYFRYSDAWQLTVNTSTSIATFLIVFLIQNTQNRDACAIHLKLDELLRAVDAARNDLIKLENLSDEQLTQLGAEFHQLSHENPAGPNELPNVPRDTRRS